MQAYCRLRNGCPTRVKPACLRLRRRPRRLCPRAALFQHVVKDADALVQVATGFLPVDLLDTGAIMVGVPRALVQHRSNSRSSAASTSLDFLPPVDFQATTQDVFIAAQPAHLPPGVTFQGHASGGAVLSGALLLLLGLGAALYKAILGGIEPAPDLPALDAAPVKASLPSVPTPAAAAAVSVPAAKLAAPLRPAQSAPAKASPVASKPTTSAPPAAATTYSSPTPHLATPTAASGPLGQVVDGVEQLVERVNGALLDLTDVARAVPSAVAHGVAAISRSSSPLPLPTVRVEAAAASVVSTAPQAAASSTPNSAANAAQQTTGVAPSVTTPPPSSAAAALTANGGPWSSVVEAAETTAGQKQGVGAAGVMATQAQHVFDKVGQLLATLDRQAAEAATQGNSLLLQSLDRSSTTAAAVVAAAPSAEGAPTMVVPAAAAAASPVVAPSAEAAAAKVALAEAVHSTARGLSATSDQRAAIEELLTRLEGCSPSKTPTQASQVLAGRWKLVYTSNRQTLLLLSAMRALPLVSVGDVVQIIDADGLTAQNKVDVAMPLLVSLTAHNTFEVRTPRQFKVRFTRVGLDTHVHTPPLLAALEVPDAAEVVGRRVDLRSLQVLAKAFNAGVESANSFVSGLVAPEWSTGRLGEAAPMWLLTTYLDDTLRVSRDGTGRVFVMQKDDALLSTASSA